MALFKILKGPEAALPTTKKEGWAYVTNEGNFYVDISDILRVKINSNADFSIKAENDSSNQKITDTYIKDVIYNQSGTAPYYTLKLGDSTLKATNGVTDKVIIPVANTTDAGVVTIDKQTFAGAKTFNALITAKLGLTSDKNISTAKQLVSTIENGTAPLVVSSKTLVTNLNADTVDGLHASNNLFNAEDSSTTILPTQRAVWSSLNDLLVAAHALVYRGIIDPTDSRTHPSAGKVGDVYIISKEGTFAGVYCEPGDMAIYYASGWDIVQVNINGAVVIKDGGAYNSAHATTNAISRFEDTTGRVIKNSKVIIDDTGNMTPVNKNTQNLGSKENVWNTIYGSTFTGTSKQAISDDQGQVIKNFYLQDVVLNTSASAPYYTLKLGNGLFKDTDGTSGADKVIIPVASATQAGVITADKTNAQTITGAKIIDSNGSLEVKKAEGFNYSGIQIASAAGARSVWFSHLNSSGTPCINNSFKFDPDETLNIANWSNEKSGTKSSVLHVPHIDGLAYKALRDSQGLVIDDTYIKDVVLTNNATAPYYTLTLGNGLSKANADGTNQKVLLPVAGQNYAGVVTNAAQTIYGVKTFNNSIIAKSDHDFISHSNEFNVIPKLSANIAFNFNYRQKDGNGAGKITQYNFCNGAGGILASISQGQFSGNAATATKATQDSTGQQINTTYIKSVRLVSGTNPSYEFTRGDNTTFSVKVPISDLDGHYVKKTGDTMTGNLTINATLSAGTKLRLWSDGEGGNIRFITPGNANNIYEFDNWNNTLRLYYSTNGDGALSKAWYFQPDGTLESTKFKGVFEATSGFGKVYTFTKTLRPTTSWIRTGIISSDLPTGIYIIYMTGLYDKDMSWQNNNIYAGIVSWYAGNTNSDERFEILLHSSGHAHNGYKIFLSTMSHLGNLTDSTTLELKSSVAFSRDTVITFKFVKIL